MNFVKKIADFFRSLVSKKTDSTHESDDQVISKEKKISGDSKFLVFLRKASAFLYKYLRKLIIFILGLINTMMRPMIKISKKHPIAFWAAVILHAALLFGLLYANVERWDAPQQASSVSQAAPVQAVMIDMEIIEAEQDRLKDVEKQKQQKLKNEEKRSETAKKDQKVAEQEALKAKAQKVFAEVKRKAEEAKAKEAEKLASQAVEKIAEAESKAKIEELKAKEAEAKRIAEEAKTKEAEIQVLEAEKQKAAAEALRKAEEVKTRLAELKRKAEEARTKEAELLAEEAAKEAKEAEILAKEAEEKRIEEELKAKDAVKEAEKLAEEKAREAEILAQEVAKQVKKAEEKRKTEEARAKEAEEKRKLEEEKAKLAEKEKDEAKRLAEEERIRLDELEAERTAQQLAFENEQYNRLLTQEVQAEQDLEREARIADQRAILESAWIANIAARVRAFWRYQGAEDDWTAEVYVIQDRDGTVMAVDVRNTNVGNSSKAKAFRDSIERAVKKSSPFPAAPDEAVFQNEILFIFGVN